MAKGGIKFLQRLFHNKQFGIGLTLKLPVMIINTIFENNLDYYCTHLQKMWLLHIVDHTSPAYNNAQPLPVPVMTVSVILFPNR